jgi:hypothetical protein
VTSETAHDRAEKEQALEAVLKSRSFARSDQLQGFLRYICEMELAGRGNEITEYLIATGALHRPSDYTPNEDSSVRSRAHALRHKLQEFYETESAEAEWRIELPKGTYRPQFVKRSKAPKPIQVQEKKRRGIEIRPVMLAIVLVLTATVIVLALFLNGVWGSRVDSVVREAWGAALAPESEVLIVVGCPPLARLSRSPNGLRLKRNPLIVAPPEIMTWYEDQGLENAGGPIYLAGSRGYTVFADMLAANQVTSLLTKVGATFQTTPETIVPMMTIHERGLVVIGAPAYTGIASRVLNATPFSVRYDAALQDEVITDGHKSYAPSRDSTDRFSTVYGLITVLPSQPGRSRPERTIIFSGITGSPGAQAAIQFFTSPGALRDLQARFHKEGYKQFPAAYQVVVRCGVDKEAAINSVYETHRIMANTPVIQ